jgi:short-subunit dehydrogenase
VHTEFGEVAGVPKDSLPSFVFATAAQVVDASLRGVERGEVVCVPGTVESLLSTVIDVLPRWLLRRATRGLTRRYINESTLPPAFTEY